MTSIKYQHLCWVGEILFISTVKCCYPFSSHKCRGRALFIRRFVSGSLICVTPSTSRPARMAILVVTSSLGSNPRNWLIDERGRCCSVRLLEVEQFPPNLPLWHFLSHILTPLNSLILFVFSVELHIYTGSIEIYVVTQTCLHTVVL